MELQSGKGRGEWGSIKPYDQWIVGHGGSKTSWCWTKNTNLVGQDCVGWKEEVVATGTWNWAYGEALVMVMIQFRQQAREWKTGDVAFMLGSLEALGFSQWSSRPLKERISRNWEASVLDGSIYVWWIHQKLWQQWSWRVVMSQELILKSSNKREGLGIRRWSIHRWAECSGVWPYYIQSGGF